MKTKTQLTTLALLLSVMFATNTFAIKRDIKFEEETYIDDISFNTEWVVQELTCSAFEMDDEAYIDDIPFNTNQVVLIYNYDKTVSDQFDLEEESIDDLPFETKQVVEIYHYNNSLLVDFYLDDQAYIEDIPFDTYSIAKNHYEKSKNNLFACRK